MKRHFVLLWALFLLELVTAAGLFIILDSPNSRGVSDLSGDTLAASRGDLLPPPEILARDIVYNASFLQSNDLKGYLAAFPPGFASRLLHLNGAHRVLDAGAGEAVFAEELVSLNRDKTPYHLFGDLRDQLFRHLIARGAKERPHVVAVDVEIRRKKIPKYGGKLEVLSGRLFEEIPKSILGEFDLIVDNQGVFAYAVQIDSVLGKYLDLLKPNGAIYIALGDPVTGYGAESKVRGGKDDSLVGWLKRIEGIHVEIPRFNSSVAVISKVGPVRISRLRLVGLEPRGGGAPVRVYQGLEEFL